MSDAPSNPPAETKPEEGKKPAPAGPALPVLLGAAGGALVVGAVLGMFVVGPLVVKMRKPADAATAAAEGKEKGKEKKKEGKKGAGEAALFKLENVIVNPAGSQGARFVMTTVAFQLEDEKQNEAMRAKEIQLRDKVVGVIESQTLEALTLPGARDTLRARIARAVEPIIHEEVPHVEVFLPSFVIQ
jgi:flagellar protein FliL